MTPTTNDLGQIVTLSATQRNPEIEERFQIFPGRTYGVRICGINPQMSASYVGILDSVTMPVDQRGFDLRRIELRDGLIDAGTLFERESISLVSNRLLDFGYVEDEEGFRRRRENLLYQSNAGGD